MSKIKKLLLPLALLLLLSAAGCSSGGGKGASLTVVCTVFPEYDWAKAVLGENPAGAELKLLLSGGTDMHSYNPTAADMVAVSSASVFVHVGGESDSWVADALSEAKNKDMRVVNLLSVLGDRAREEELREGMEGESEDAEYDEHVWLSLKNAELFCSAIAEAVAEADPANAALYRKNAEAYIAELRALDAEYAAAVAAAPRRTLLFGDRFPFRYLVEDYGLDYYAAFPGCSAETEASFSTVTFLAGKVDELGLKYVLTLENSDGRIASTIIENTASKSASVLELDSLQSVSASSGETYLGVMRRDLAALKTALS